MLIKSFVAVDIETNGLNCEIDDIIKISATKVVDGTISDRFATFVRCDKELPKRIEQLTGITDKDLENAPSITEAIKMLLEFCGNLPLIGYNTDFDVGFLARHMDTSNMLDVQPEVEKKLQGVIESFKLSTVSKYFGLQLDDRDTSLCIAQIALLF